MSCILPQSPMSAQQQLLRRLFDGINVVSDSSGASLNSIGVCGIWHRVLSLKTLQGRTMWSTSVQDSIGIRVQRLDEWFYWGHFPQGERNLLSICGYLEGLIRSQEMHSHWPEKMNIKIEGISGRNRIMPACLVIPPALILLPRILWIPQRNAARVLSVKGAEKQGIYQ